MLDLITPPDLGIFGAKKETIIIIIIIIIITIIIIVIIVIVIVFVIVIIIMYWCFPRAGTHEATTVMMVWCD